MTMWKMLAPAVCAAAVENSTPRVTVQLVVPAPAVTSRNSFSIRMTNCLVGSLGNPANVLTVIAVAPDVIVPERVAQAVLGLLGVGVLAYW